MPATAVFSAVGTCNSPPSPRRGPRRGRRCASAAGTKPMRPVRGGSRAGGRRAATRAVAGGSPPLCAGRDGAGPPPPLPPPPRASLPAPGGISPPLRRLPRAGSGPELPCPLLRLPAEGRRIPHPLTGRGRVAVPLFGERGRHGAGRSPPARPSIPPGAGGGSSSRV